MDFSNGSPDDDPPTAPPASNPYPALSDALNQVVSDRYHVELNLVQYPSQGNFAWCYQNNNQVFNQWTRDYLSARIFPGDSPGLAQLSSPGGLTELGIRLTGSLTYRLSAEDESNADQAVLAIRDKQLRRIRHMRAAGAAPSAANGGMLSVDPVTGVVGKWQPAYAVSASLPTIASALSGSGDALEVTVMGQGAAQVTFTYPNCVLVGCGPVAWQDATRTGWWVDEPIGEAFANRGRDVTGFAFLTPPPFEPAPISSGGTAGHISGLLLSNPPTLQIDGIQATQAFSPGGSPADDTGATGPPAGVLGKEVPGLSPPVREVLAPFALLGLGVEGGLSYIEAQPAPSNGSQTLEPEAATIYLTPVADPTVPLLQQTAYVVGAVVGTW